MTEGKEVVSDVGAVAAGPEEAARVGARILEQGGNAMDAAAATSMACCLLEPHRTGIMGYVCCAVVLDGKLGKVWSLDANARAPMAAHESMFEILPILEGAGGINENEYQCTVRDNANVHGPLSVGPPGMMAGMGTLWERWGNLKWEEIVAPSLKLLEDGFPFGTTAAAVRGLEEVIKKFPASEKHLMPEGRLPEADDIWHRADLEKSLQRASDHGWRDFYEGEIGQTIADHILDTGGVITRKDMATFEPRVTEPYGIRYRDAEVYSAILPNGGLSLLQALNFMDQFESVSDDEIRYWHRWAEVFKRVWRDRLEYLGDTDFVDVDVEKLLSRDYAAGRMESLRQFPSHVDARSLKHPIGGEDGTTHVSAADREGNVAAVTISQGGGFGSCVTVPETGLILGHGMCRLDPRPGRRNSIAAGKRPLNNTGPLIARLPDKDIGTGLPGGRRIICVNTLATQRMIDFRSTSLEAASAPRLHVLTSEPVVVSETLPESIREGLEGMGHELNVVEVGGQVHCAEWLKDEKKVRAGGNTWAAGAEKKRG